jgi:hypothetical protein
MGAPVGAGRAGWRIMGGDTTLAHAIEANKVMIKELESRGPMTSMDLMIYEDLKITQSAIEELGQNPKNLTLSARDAYQIAWRKFEGMNMDEVPPATVGSALADEHIDNVAPAGKDIPPAESGTLPPAMVSDDAPMADFSIEGGLSMRQPLAEGVEAGENAVPRTMGELRVQLQQGLDEAFTDYEKLLGCVRG